MIHSDSIVKLAAALSKAQGAIKGAKKDSVNPHFKAAYADLESTWEACREPLSKNGLSIIQFPYSRDGKIGIETMLLHDSGEWIRGEIDVKMTAETNPQVAGSIITYLRRYSLQGAVGIAPADDDANAASPKPTTAPAPVPDAAPPPAQTPTVAPPVAEGEMSENDMRDAVALIMSQIADKVNSTRKPEEGKIDAGDVLYSYTVNKDGKYGKRKVNDVPFMANKKDGGTWNPLAAVLSKGKEELKKLGGPLYPIENDDPEWIK